MWGDVRSLPCEVTDHPSIGPNYLVFLGRVPWAPSLALGMGGLWLV